MFWFICTIIQLVLWWVTFFKSKKMVRETVGSGWNASWGKFSLTNERYHFPLWQVALSFVGCFIPIGGLFVLLPTYTICMGKRNNEWEEKKPHFVLIEFFKKEI